MRAVNYATAKTFATVRDFCGLTPTEIDAAATQRHTAAHMLWIARLWLERDADPKEGATCAAWLAWALVVAANALVPRAVATHDHAFASGVGSAILHEAVRRRP